MPKKRERLALAEPPALLDARRAARVAPKGSRGSVAVKGTAASASAAKGNAASAPAAKGNAPFGLAQLPAVHRLLASAKGAELCARFGREETRDALRAILAALREAHLGESTAKALFTRVLDLACVRLDATRTEGLQRLVNATGVVLHTNLGRAPLAPEAMHAALEVGIGYSNLEFDLETASRGTRHVHVESLLSRLTGAEAALVVNNGAAGVLLALAAHASGGEVVTSRGELIEIGGAFRIPDVIAQSGAVLVEVGTTNRTRIADYERALTERTRVILRSHCSNYRILGFIESAPARALAQLAHAHGLLFIEDLGSGTLVDLARFGLPAIRLRRASIRLRPEAQAVDSPRCAAGAR